MVSNSQAWQSRAGTRGPRGWLITTVLLLWQVVSSMKWKYWIRSVFLKRSSIVVYRWVTVWGGGGSVFSDIPKMLSFVLMLTHVDQASLDHTSEWVLLWGPSALWGLQSRGTQQPLRVEWLLQNFSARGGQTPSIYRHIPGSSSLRSAGLVLSINYFIIFMFVLFLPPYGNNQPAVLCMWL